MRTLLFLDLDDTIFQTRPKCPDGVPLRPAAYHRDGAPLSFMTDGQRAMLDTICRGATVIPATARNLDAFRRVDMPFSDGAILNFGGVILRPDGSLDPDWDAHVRPHALAAAPELQQIQRQLEASNARQQLGTRIRIIRDFDMPLYVVVKHRGGDAAQLEPLHAELCATLDRARFFVHRNDNNLSVVPRFLGKERAVRHYLDRTLGGERVLTIGMADSLTDAAFLDLCDFSITPRGCQLARLWRAEEQ